MKVKASVNPKAFGYQYDPMEDGVSQSILEGWLNCRQLAYLRTIRGLTPHAPSRPLIHGSISHGAVKYGLRGIMSGATTRVSQLQRGAPADVEVAHVDWEREQGSNADSGSRDIAEESSAILKALLPVYWGHWGAKDLKTKWAKVEDRFRVHVDTTAGSVPLVGQFDGVFLRNGRPALLETKNKSQWSPALADLLPLDLQLGVYLTAMALSEKADPSVVVYNLIRRPGERRKKTETLAGFSERIAKNARLDPGHYFERIEIELTTQEKNRHKDRVSHLLGTFVQWCQWKSVTEPSGPAKAHAPFGDLGYNSSYCENKYGTCPFLAVCGREDLAGFYVRQHAHPELAESP